MQLIEVHFDNGDFFSTHVNGSIEEIERYYLGRTFNLGATSDNLHRCIRIVYLDTTEDKQ